MSRTQPFQSGLSSGIALDSARQAGDLAALRRMLVVSQGCFSLSFAVCNQRLLRDELIERLLDEFPGIAVVELPPQVTDVYQAVRDRLAGVAAEAVFVLNLEASVPSADGVYPTLRSLNSSRELWERLECPVVFWLADYAAALLAAKAPDLWRYRSHQFEFVSHRASVGEATSEPFPGYALVDALPFEEKRFRMAELEQRLEEAGPNASRDLLPHALNWMYELAHLYRQASQFARASELLDRALAFAKAEYGSDDPRTAIALNNVAQMLQVANRFPEAESLTRRALDIEELSLGPDHPNVATGLNNLGVLLVATNRLREAEPLLRRALAIDEESLAPDHPNVARDLGNLAKLLHQTGHLSEAEGLARRALAIDERILGAEHPQVATHLNNLAQVLQDTNRLTEAESLLRRALSIDEYAFGPDHPDIATHLNNLAQVHVASNRLYESELLMRRAAGILLRFSRKSGVSHRHLHSVLDNLALLFRAQGKSETEIQAEIEALKRDALADETAC